MCRRLGKARGTPQQEGHVHVKIQGAGLRTPTRSPLQAPRGTLGRPARVCVRGRAWETVKGWILEKRTGNRRAPACNACELQG